MTIYLSNDQLRIERGSRSSMHLGVASSSWRVNVGPSCSESVHSREQLNLIGGNLARSLIPTTALARRCVNS